MPQYLSTDPNAGLQAQRYLSTDPNAGESRAAASRARVLPPGGPVLGDAANPRVAASRARTRAGGGGLPALSSLGLKVGEAYAEYGPRTVLSGMRHMADAASAPAYDLLGNMRTMARGVHELITGGAVTAAPFIAPQLAAGAIAAPVGTATRIGLGAVGQVTAKAGAEMSGAGEEFSNLAGDAGAIVAGGPVATKAINAAKKAGQTAAEYLYGRVFKDSAKDAAARFASKARGETTPTLAREVMERGISGSHEEMAVESINRLHALEPRLKFEAGRSIMRVDRKSDIVRLLDQMEEQFNQGMFSERSAEAARLAAALRAAPGQAVKATDILDTRRFLDGLRATSTFGLDPSMSMKQEELKIAADLLRGTLHKNPRLSPLINEERVYLRARDAAVADAVKHKNAGIFGITDAALVAPLGEAGVVAATAVRGARMPQVTTGVGQFLHRASGGVQRPTDLTLPPQAMPLGLPAGAVRPEQHGPSSAPFVPVQHPAVMRVPSGQRQLPAGRPISFIVDEQGRVSTPDGAEAMAAAQRAVDALRMDGSKPIKGLLPAGRYFVDESGMPRPAPFDQQSPYVGLTERTGTRGAATPDPTPGTTALRRAVDETGGYRHPAGPSSARDRLRAAEEAYDTSTAQDDPAALRSAIDTARAAVIEERVGPINRQEFDAPAPQADVTRLRKTQVARSKSDVIAKANATKVKPAVATVTAKTPETPTAAAKKVVGEVRRVVDTKGAKGAADVQRRVMAALEGELAGSREASGVSELTVVRRGGGERAVVTSDGQLVGSIDQYGRWRRSSSTSASMKTTREEHALAMGDGGKLEDFTVKGMTPTEVDRQALLSAAAAIGRGKGAGRLTVEIPGDGEFTIERNPHAIQTLIQRIKSGGSSPWKGIK